MHCLVTAGALALLVLHLVFPHLPIDATAMALFSIAAIPWLGAVLKSVKLPGGVEAQWREDVAEAGDKAREAGLLEAKGQAAALNARSATGTSATATMTIGKEADHQAQVSPPAGLSPWMIVKDDPNLALAAARLRLEQELRQLAKDSDAEISGSAGSLVSSLFAQEVITAQEREAIRKVLAVLNAGVHGITADPSTTHWALDVSESIIASLRNRRHE